MKTLRLPLKYLLNIITVYLQENDHFTIFFLAARDT